MSDTEMIAESLDRWFIDHMSPEILDNAEKGGWAEDLWVGLEEHGYMRLLLSEENGGTGGGWADAYALLYVAAFHCAPLPIAETLVANNVLAQAGLPVKDGVSTIVQQPDDDSLDIREDGSYLVLHGTVQRVPWASHASRIVVAGRLGEKPVVAVVPTDADGLQISASTSIASEPLDSVVFERCRCTEFVLVPTSSADAPVLIQGALARAVQMSGLLESVLRQTVCHVKDRQQFGRPLMSMQAVKQSLAVLAANSVAADVAVRAACDAGDSAISRFDVAVAKIQTGKAAAIGARIAHQLHGAMGFTYEHPLHHATRRLWSWRTDFGNDAYWAKEIGRKAAMRGGAAFWPDLTARRMIGQG